VACESRMETSLLASLCGWNDVDLFITLTGRGVTTDWQPTETPRAPPAVATLSTGYTIY